MTRIRFHNGARLTINQRQVSTADTKLRELFGGDASELIDDLVPPSTGWDMDLAIAQRIIKTLGEGVITLHSLPGCFPRQKN